MKDNSRAPNDSAGRAVLTRPARAVFHTRATNVTSRPLAGPRHFCGHLGQGVGAPTGVEATKDLR